MRPAVHQFHPSIEYGDAVTNGLLLTQELLRAFGFESEIYVAQGDARIERHIRDYREYVPSANNVLLVHHSLGHGLLDWVLALPDRKVLVYHNITPAAFFADNAKFRQPAELGRRQLLQYRTGVVASLCDSAFNAEELIALGYDNVTVLPLLIDTERVRRLPWNARIVDANASVFTVLFVGRVERNKCQHDVVEVYRHLARWLDRPSQLVFVGRYDPDTRYFHELQYLVASHGLTDRVRFVGHVASEDLIAWYRTADVFVSMSEHEGFGVPLIEAMTFDVPVIAHASSSVPHTLGGAGILVDGKPLQDVAALVCTVADDRALRRRIVRRQRSRSAEFSLGALKPRFAAVLASLGLPSPAESGATDIELPREAAIQIEGPFESSYSLAIINRELALALDAQEPGSVALYPTEGPGEYEPDRAAIRAMPAVERLWARGRKGSMADVVIRNLYPPRVADMDGDLNLLNFFWEESALPQVWVDAFNRHLDGICVASRFVKKVLVDAGVHIPIRVIGAGVDHVLREEREPYAGALGRSFRFLHVSSAFPRKGIDVLLEAYAAAFSDGDDVSLVIKTFPNIHNETESQIRALRQRHARCPDIVLIDRDLPAGQVIDIYEHCHAFVAPSRGEGFGLPIAEAMLLGLPVITTAFGGQSDFCTDETCWRVDFHFTRARTHMDLFDSVWAEPDVEDIARAMRAVVGAHRLPVDSKIPSKMERASDLITRSCTWARSAVRLRAAVPSSEKERPLPDRPIRLGWTTTWNSKCGIARYSHFLLSHLPPTLFETTIFASRKDAAIAPDGPNVIRCWDDCMTGDVADLKARMAEARLDAAVIQFNFGFFPADPFGVLLEDLTASGVKTIVLFHRTRDCGNASLRAIRTALARVDRLLVHGIADLNVLKSFGLLDNVTLFPQGVPEHRPADLAGIRARLGLAAVGPVIASYGFLLPPKGIEQLIEAFASLLRVYPNATLLLVNALYPIPDSEALRDRCAALIDRLRIRGRVALVTDFLEDEESLCLLECADVIVYPYQGTEESSSAAVRFGLASGRAVACTPLEIFDDVAEVVHFLPGMRPGQIAEFLIELLGNRDLLGSKRVRQEQWLRAHSWKVLTRRLSGIVRALVNEQPEDEYLVAPERAMPERPRGQRCSPATTPESVQMN